MRIFFIALMGLLLTACGSESKAEKPANLIEKNKMIDVLVDTYITNAARSKSFQEIKEENIRLDKFILQKYDIDSLQFVQSNAYYAHDIDDYVQMLEQVEARILAQKTESFGEEREMNVPIEEGDEDI